MLGVHLAPDGNNAAELQHLKEAATEWKKKMTTANLPRAAVEFSLQQVLMPKLRYPLLATTFTVEECHKIMKLIMAQALPVPSHGSELKLPKSGGAQSQEIPRTRNPQTTYRTTVCTHQSTATTWTRQK